MKERSPEPPWYGVNEPSIAEFSSQEIPHFYPTHIGYTTNMKNENSIADGLVLIGSKRH